MNRTDVSDSIWEKEIRFRGEPSPAAESWMVREFVIPEPKERWWNKDISLSRPSRSTSEAPREPKEPKEPKRLPPLSPKAPSSPKPPRSPKPSHGRSERVVGLKIGGSQIAAACIVNGGRIRLEKVARTPLASGIVVDGELRDPQNLAAALRSFFAEHKLPRRGIRLGIASSRIGVRSFEISGIEDERQFVNAIRFRAQEALPIPLEEAVLDYRVLDERVGEDGERIRRVLLVVAHRELVERYVEACRLAGLTLAGIDLEALRAPAGLRPARGA